MKFRLLPGLAKRCEVLTGIAIEHQLIMYSRINRTRITFWFWKLVFWQASRKIGGGVEVILKLVPDRTFVVQGHCLSLSFKFTAARLFDARQGGKRRFGCERLKRACDITVPSCE